MDRLLASPQYGERMAMQWLDLARYADTHGYHIDSQRDMWKWRDWVIDAFNRNMPFDRFGIEQLAGDLLPNATVEQKAGQRFQPQPHDQLRRRRDSGGVSGGVCGRPRRHHRNVFMGLTMGCARCHDHKYDPISQKDYYRFFAFFNHRFQTRESTMPRETPSRFSGFVSRTRGANSTS